MHSWFIVGVAAYITAQNFTLAACQSWLSRRGDPFLRWPTFAWFAWALLMTLLFLVEAFDPHGWKTFLRQNFYLPMAVQMAWNILLIQVLLPVTLFGVIVARIHDARLKRLREQPASGMSRRRFLYLVGCGAVPATAMTMGVYGTATRYDLRTRRFTVPIADLPAELEGFTIAHVSDLHSGLFVGAERLKLITDATNDLKPDMIALTGDIINRDMDEFPAALAAIKRMESRYGLFACEGNHDVIPGEKVLVQACQANGVTMLYNECLAVPVRGRRLLLGGLSWNQLYFVAERPNLVGELFPARQPNDVRILFAHHPHFFDVAAPADLVLSGHTHGGQIMIGDNVGLGRLRFKYCSGLFQRDRTSMIVSNGAGDWFPCRIGAPAEVGLIRLTRATTT